jgi:NADPH-dependent 2,4-dienoyl-CoA reductase/sulfur reductase-like enzyme
MCQGGGPNSQSGRNLPGVELGTLRQLLNPLGIRTSGVIFEEREIAADSVLVVGAGLTGMTAAIELRRRGFVVRIVDKSGGLTAYATQDALA